MEDARGAEENVVAVEASGLSDETRSRGEVWSMIRKIGRDKNTRGLTHFLDTAKIESEIDSWYVIRTGRESVVYWKIVSQYTTVKMCSAAIALSLWQGNLLLAREIGGASKWSTLRNLLPTRSFVVSNVHETGQFRELAQLLKHRLLLPREIHFSGDPRICLMSHTNNAAKAAALKQLYCKELAKYDYTLQGHCPIPGCAVVFSDGAPAHGNLCSVHQNSTSESSRVLPPGLQDEVYAHTTPRTERLPSWTSRIRNVFG